MGRNRVVLTSFTDRIMILNAKFYFMYFHGAELYHSYKCLKDYLLHANQQ